MKQISAIVLAACAALNLHAQETPQASPFVSASGQEGTAATIPLTIQQAESIALQKNPQITVGKLRALQANELIREARSVYYPTANLSLTGVGSDAGSRVAAGFLTNPIVYPRAAVGASVSQLITDFGRTNNLVASFVYQAKAEDQNATATRQQIILAVDQVFYNALETKALLQVAQQTVQARQVLVDQVQALTNAKLKSDLDLSFANVDLARAKLLQLDSQNNYEASLSTLSAILGYPDRQNFSPVDPSLQAPPPATEAEPLIQKALQLRPEVQSLQDQVISSEKNARAEHDLWRPTVQGLGVVGLAPVRDPHVDNWYGAAGVNINIPVFNGFSFNARAKSAELETQAKQQQLQDLRNNVSRDVRNAWLGTQKAFERLSVTKQLREQATLALDLAQARYKLGLSSIVEYSQAELQKTEADLEDTDAHYQYQVSKIFLDYSMGITR